MMILYSALGYDSKWLEFLCCADTQFSQIWGALHFDSNAYIIGNNHTFRLQTGMRGAFGKPQGTVARVRIGQPIMSVRSSDRFKAQVVEALRRAKFKFPGRQKVCTLNFWYHVAKIFDLLLINYSCNDSCL